jgi:KDO2-lipid IV(A) lauroyltransferase
VHAHRRPAPADVREGARWSFAQRLKNDVLYVLVRGALTFASMLPRRALEAACRALGRIGYLLLVRLRAIVRARLVAGLGPPAAESLVLRTFVTAGELLADTIALLRPEVRASDTLMLAPDAARVFRDALDERRGVVFIAAHLGPWERMAALLVEEGFPVATVARESYDPRLTAIYEQLRRPRGVRAIYRGHKGAILAVARELQQGRAVGFLVDVPARVPSVAGNLFGSPTFIPVGPARIALARHAAVVVGTCAPPQPGVSGEPPRACIQITRIPTEDLSNEPDAVHVLVTRITQELDRRIAAWPEAWLGMFTPLRLRPPLDPR